MNQVIVTAVGNLVADPKPRTTPTGVPGANFRIASSERRRDPSTGEWRDVHTSFFQVTCWRATADRVLATLRKGDTVIVSGRLQVHNWQNPEGVWHTIVDIDATSIGPDLSRHVVTMPRQTPPVAPPPEPESTPWSAPLTADSEQPVEVREPAA
jgi:single-strand DNA-binding protein